ncbi:MAG: four helix bundle protein [Flavobacteriales bacterium]|nr:four helix bundle protein [Flavobacteriales bacterium]
MVKETFNADEWLASFWNEQLAEPQLGQGASYRRKNPVVDETFGLASHVMDYCESLVRINPVFADQILRSGTSVGSHVREAQGAQSLRAFLNKMKVAHQELEETDFRLDLCHIKAHYPHDPDLVRRTKVLFPLFHSILKTTTERLARELSEKRNARKSGTEKP